VRPLRRDLNESNLYYTEFFKESFISKMHIYVHTYIYIYIYIYIKKLILLKIKRFYNNKNNFLNIKLLIILLLKSLTLNNFINQ